MKPRTVQEYLDSCPENVRPKMEKIRQIIQQAAPSATELLSYGMPAFKDKKILVYFAANKAHIGFYPTASPIEAFKKELAGFETSKGAIHFPLDKPLPISLIRKIVKFRWQETRPSA